MIWIISLIQILLILIKVLNLLKISWFIVFVPAYVLIGTLVLLIVFNRLNKKVVIRRD